MITRYMCLLWRINRALRDETGDGVPIVEHAAAHGCDVGGSQGGGGFASDNLHGQVQNIGGYLHPQGAAAAAVGCYDALDRATGLAQQGEMMGEAVTDGFQDGAVEMGARVMQHDTGEDAP